VGRWRLCIPLCLVWLAGCDPQPAPRPLDAIAAKPEQVRQQVEQTQRDHMDELKRQEAEATGGSPPEPAR
jgi:hypothetical protein